VQVGDLVVEVVHSICQIEPLAARQTLKARTFACVVTMSACVTVRAACSISTFTWYGSLSSCTSRAPFRTLLLSSTSTRTT
jgi:hypothetical protein